MKPIPLYLTKASRHNTEGKVLNHGFTKEEIPNICMLPFKILKEPKLMMFQVKIIQNILPTQSSLLHERITDTYTDVCPLCNLESQSLKGLLWDLNSPRDCAS